MSKIVRLCDTFKEVSILLATVVKTHIAKSLTTVPEDIECPQVPRLYVLGLQDESTSWLFHWGSRDPR